MPPDRVGSDVPGKTGSAILYRLAESNRRGSDQQPMRPIVTRRASEGLAHLVLRPLPLAGASGYNARILRFTEQRA